MINKLQLTSFLVIGRVQPSHFKLTDSPKLLQTVSTKPKPLSAQPWKDPVDPVVEEPRSLSAQPRKDPVDPVVKEPRSLSAQPRKDPVDPVVEEPRSLSAQPRKDPVDPVVEPQSLSGGVVKRKRYLTRSAGEAPPLSKRMCKGSNLYK